MKKFVAVISILLLLFCHFSAFGEEIDLSAMTTDELINLQIKIQDELYTRDRFMDCFLYQGDYYIGEDIEPGDYLIHCIETDDRLRCYVGADFIDTEESVFHTMRMEEDDLLRVKLPEGVILHIVSGVVELLER